MSARRFDTFTLRYSKRSAHEQYALFFTKRLLCPGYREWLFPATRLPASRILGHSVAAKADSRKTRMTIPCKQYIRN
jgi:hypothetical protein